MVERKTIAEWLKQLPRGHRELAQANYAMRARYPANRMPNNLASALNDAFIWSETPEGHEYWSRLYRWVNKESRQPKPPRIPKHVKNHRSMAAGTAARPS